MPEGAAPVPVVTALEADEATEVVEGSGVEVGATKVEVAVA